LVFLAGIKERVGYDTKRRGFLLTRPIAHPDNLMHKVDYFLNIAGDMGFDVSQRFYEYHVDAKEASEASGILKKSGVDKDRKFAVINPGGNWGPKRWPKERFKELAEKLSLKGMQVVITGAAKDASLGEYIKGSNENVFSLCGKTGLPELGAVLEKASLVIANDSGPMHLAAALGKPVVALFGPTSYELTGPRSGENARVLWKEIGCPVPCYDYTCERNECMEAISVEEVLSCVKEITANETG
jgi:lipopolysaccharide heptosyltransferase II